jgi:glycosyltransferase involved in cell wall biosynthesis
MKIAILAHANHPIQEPYEGGLEMITALIVKALRKEGHQVDLFALGSSARNLAPVALNDPNYNWNPAELGTEAFNMNVASYYSLAFLKIKDGNYDLVHNNSLHYLPIILGNSLDIPFLTSFHTPVFPEISYALNALRSPQQYFSAVSKSLCKLYAEFGKCDVVYNGIDIDKWEFANNPSDYYFWYGRICPEKGTHTAIEAATKLGKKIYLAGPKSNMEYYINEVAPLINNQNVVYLGHLNQVEVNQWLKNARALLFTSTWDEPYGLTIAESLASGTPVVSWNKGAAPEILTNKTGRVVAPFNMVEFQNALIEIEKLDRRDCRVRAIEFCSVEKMVNGYLDLYTRMLKPKNSLNLQEVC